MRKAYLLAPTLVLGLFLASCSTASETPSRTSSGNTQTASASSSTTTQASLAKTTSCARTINEPLRGLVALTSDYVVRNWQSNTAEEFIDMPRVGDDPNAPPTEGDFNVAETAVQDPRSCNVLTGTCCEPVIGVTYFGTHTDGSPKYAMGRLPAVSPSGESVAFLAYESINIATLDKPDETVSSIAFPDATLLMVKELRWIDDENLAVLAVGSKGSFLYLVSVKDSTMSSAELLAADTTSSEGNFSDVGIAGLSDDGNLWTRRSDLSSNAGSLLELRDATDLGRVIRTEALPDRPLSYTIRNGVVVWLHADGTLQVTAPQVSPTLGGSEWFSVTLPGTYVWAD